MKNNNTILKTLIIGFISLSIPTGCNPITSPSTELVMNDEKTTVLDYVLPINHYFKTQSVQSEHQNLVDQLIQDFENDLKNDTLDGYYQIPDFSIKLLSGSEGSYFNSEQDLSQAASSEASFAQALVINADQSTQIFKGQFTNERFYFPGTNSLTSDNTTYLITLDDALQTQVYSGQLLAQSEGSYLTSPDDTSIDPGSLPKANLPVNLPQPSPISSPSATQKPENSNSPTPGVEVPLTSTPETIVPEVPTGTPADNPSPEPTNSSDDPRKIPKDCPPPPPGAPPFRDGKCPPPPPGPKPPPGKRPPGPKPPPPPPNKNSPQYKQRAKKFDKALQRHKRHFTPFSKRVKSFKLKPPPPPPRRRPPPPGRNDGSSDSRKKPPPPKQK